MDPMKTWMATLVADLGDLVGASERHFFADLFGRQPVRPRRVSIEPVNRLRYPEYRRTDESVLTQKVNRRQRGDSDFLGVKGMVKQVGNRLVANGRISTTGRERQRRFSHAILSRWIGIRKNLSGRRLKRLRSTALNSGFPI